MPTHLLIALLISLIYSFTAVASYRYYWSDVFSYLNQDVATLFALFWAVTLISALVIGGSNKLLNLLEVEWELRQRKKAIPKAKINSCDLGKS